jgi:hypothetical protein
MELSRIRQRIECALIIPMIIQSIRLPPSGPDQIDAVPDVSKPDPTGSVQFDAELWSRNRKVLGSNPSSGSVSPGQGSVSSGSAERMESVDHPFSLWQGLPSD